MVKRVLMVAFHYPPLQGGSGIQRTLGFARGLPHAGWEPIVLTASARAYPAGQSCTPAPVPDHPATRVQRSFALDASRHLALRGRYPAVMALPDRWSSWWLSAVPAGLRLIRRYRPDVIWSTYPIATAHLIGLTLHRLTGIPWVADQRDPMSEDGYPADARTWRLHRWIEQRIMARCASLVCTTPGALSAYAARFALPGAAPLALIENGYDEASFAAAGRDGGSGMDSSMDSGIDSRIDSGIDSGGTGRSVPAPGTPACIRLLHSGLVYPSERDPEALFQALAGLLAEGSIGKLDFRLVLRASGHEAHLRRLIARHGVAAVVELAPPLPYRAALAEMLAADALLLLQAANCNAQIPAKLYEYLRCARPILALTDPAGDSAAKLRHHGIDTIARLDSAPAIRSALRDFLALVRSGQAPLAAPARVALESRAARSVQLGALLDQVCTGAKK